MEEKNTAKAKIYLEGYADALRSVDDSIRRNPVDTLNNVIHNLHFNNTMIKEQLHLLAKITKEREDMEPLTRMINELDAFMENVVIMKGGVKL